MFVRGKPNKAPSTGLSQRLEEDRISLLPDPLICQILSHLPTKDSVKTSVLSIRWKSLWLWVPSLELSSEEFRDFNTFVSFGDRFFDSNRASFIDTVKLTVDEFDNGVDDTSPITSWIDALVKYTGILKTTSSFCDADLSKLSITEFVSLPCLKTMHLEYIIYPNDATFERLISACPVLEELKIIGCVNDDAKIFRVLSRSLTKLSIDLHDRFPDYRSEVVIDAPRLRLLSIDDNLSESFIIKDMDSNAKVDISLTFGLDVFDEASVSSGRTSIRSFLHAISKVRDMTICRDTFKLICLYSKIEPLPQLVYLSCMRVTFRVSDWKRLPTFLESCPNLKSLILVWNTNSRLLRTKGVCGFNFSSVPECLLSSLEFVDIKTSFSGHFKELMLVSFFLKNSTMLKKLTVRLNYYWTDEKYIVEKILEIPRRSSACQVVIC